MNTEVQRERATKQFLSFGGKTSTWTIRAVVILGIAVAAVYGIRELSYSMTHESTDDAFIEGTVVPISAEVKGRITKVLVTDNQRVNRGDILLELFQGDLDRVVQTKESSLERLKAEKRELRAEVKAKSMALLRARADLAAAETDIVLAEKDMNRARQLAGEQVISQRQLDQAEFRADSASAHRDAARAAVAEAQAAVDALKARLETQAFRIKEAQAAAGLADLELKRTVITAPISGRVAKKNADVGKYVQPGQPLLALVDDSSLWVVANFKETQIERMKPGQPVDITVDAYPGVLFKGHVDSFQPGTGAVFSLLPPQNATGNFVKVVQRVPVKILLDSESDPAHPLRPGLSVSPSVEISGR